MEVLSEPIRVANAAEPRAYEAEVFNFLLANKKCLGINSIFKFKALLVDGALELVDGQRLAVEVKFRMNWEKACQAEWQFRHFLKRHKAIAGPVNGGLVFFEEFSGDWKRYGGRLLENGWNNWYRSYSEVDGFRVDLLRLCMGKLESFPLADAINAKIE